MRFISTVALGMALTLGAGAILDVQAAHAQDQQNESRQQRRDREKRERDNAPQLSAPVRAALVAAQTAIQAQDWATARAKVNEGAAAATTPDEKYMSGSLLYQVGLGTNDAATQGAALDAMLASGKTPAANVAQFNLVRGNLAYQAQDWARAETALKESVRAGAPDLTAYALLAEAQARQGKNADAVAAVQAAYEHEKAAGRVLPNDYFGRGINIARAAKLGPQFQQLSAEWLSSYPAPDNWRDTLILYRELNPVDADYNLDIMRLQRTARALKGERDFAEYLEAVYLRFPGEAKAVVDEGVAAGAVQLRAGGNLQVMSQAAAGRLAADRADLAGSATASRNAANGRSALATADSYLGYGDAAKAIELYRIALQKGGVDANVVNTRLGAALVKSGDLAGAKQVFASVTGPRAALAQYWTIWIDNLSRPAAAAPAPAAQPAN